MNIKHQTEKILKNKELSELRYLYWKGIKQFQVFSPLPDALIVVTYMNLAFPLNFLPFQINCFGLLKTHFFLQGMLTRVQWYRLNGIRMETGY